jgi:hypothetical protein
MITSPKNAIQAIATGSDYYFRFKTIDVIRNGSLLTKLTSANCEDSTSTFRKGGPGGGMIAQLDFDESGMSAIQRVGAFIGMDSGFDLYLIGPWRWIMKSGAIHAIAYDVNAGGIAKFVITAGDERDAINVQIFTSDGYIIQLGDPMTFSVD